MMDEAGVEWNDPLSASSYKKWHDLAPNRIDNVEATGNNLLTLSTLTDDHLVYKESLTVRADNFHPVMRSVLFRDKQVIEIAELSYNIVPWNKESESWFEPENRSSSSDLEPRRTFHIPPPTHLSESQLDEAQLHVLLALNQLHADTERLEVSRKITGVEVKGVVETEERKQQIISILKTIPHVTLQILSYRDMERDSPPGKDIAYVTAVSVASSTSPMEQYCEDNHLEQERCRQLSYQLLNSATAIVRDSNQITDLLAEFTPATPLTPDAVAILNALLLADIADINGALLQQKHAIAAFNIPSISNSNAVGADHNSLATAAQYNLSLTKELVYAGNNRSRPAESTLMELASSFNLIQTSVSRLPRAFPAGSTSARSGQAPQP
jgi:hypothetical protein